MFVSDRYFSGSLENAVETEPTNAYGFQKGWMDLPLSPEEKEGTHCFALLKRPQ